MIKKKIAVLLSFALALNVTFTSCTNKTTTENKKANKVTEANEAKDEMKSDDNSISTEDLKKKIATLNDKDSSENFIVVDTRSEASYVGWKLDGENRGGHIKSAVDFPTTWLDKVDGSELEALLASKGIEKNKEVILYAENAEGAAKFEEKLKSLDYKNVKVYKEGFATWAADESNAVDALPRYDKLVYPAWVNSVINGEKAPNYDNKKFVVVEVSWGEGKDYAESHIPGAVHLDTGLIEVEPLWNLVSDADLEKVITGLGIDKDTTVILYGPDTTPAARAASVMMYAGVEDVRVLNGGYTAWLESGFKTESGRVDATPVSDFGVKVPANPQYIINTDEAKEIIADDKGALVSIRSWAEYKGDTSGYTYIEPKGRIKGSTWGHAGSDAYHLEDFRNIDNTMKNYHEIEKFWKEWGITSDKKVSYYCGTGWRASETFFYAYLMGWDNISVYDGGWYEWSSDPSNPTETGEPVNDSSK